MSNTPPNASTFVAQTLEDAVKAGLGGAGIGGGADLVNAIHTTALQVAAAPVGFVAAAIASIILSLISQPFGNKSTNHVFGQVEDDGLEVLRAIIADVASQQQDTAPAQPSQAVPAQPAYQAPTEAPTPAALPTHPWTPPQQTAPAVTIPVTATEQQTSPGRSSVE